jgi:hypothetical protein
MTLDHSGARPDATCFPCVAPTAAFCCALILVLITCPSLPAQSVTGRVLDDATGERIPLAGIALLDADGEVVRTVVSDSAGVFAMSTGRPGVYRLRTRALGYAEHTTDTLRVASGETLTIVIRVAAQGIPLQPLEVYTRRGDERGRFGFERRRDLGRGVFLTADSITLRSPRLVSDAFYGVPGVLVQENLTSISISSMYGARCFSMFIDHRPWPVTTDQMNQILDVRWVRGVEIYRDMSEVPRELRTAARSAFMWRGGGRTPLSCGLVWVWTDLGW